MIQTMVELNQNKWKKERLSDTDVFTPYLILLTLFLIIYEFLLNFSITFALGE